MIGHDGSRGRFVLIGARNSLAEVSVRLRQLPELEEMARVIEGFVEKLDAIIDILEIEDPPAQSM